MHSYKNPHLEGQKPGCSRSNTGYCVDCPMYIALPVNIEDPVTGEVVEAGTQVQCVDVWVLMASLRAGREVLRLHQGVNQSQNEANRREDNFYKFVAGNLQHAPPDVISGHLEHGDHKNQQAG